jgi:bifunctional DNA-binding transcriptional regulator/antitoxin component of YhaV-PrlF toxin-antitoxin module
MKVAKKTRVPGRTRISAKRQVTLPVNALRQAGLEVGDELQVEAAEGGRIILVRAVDAVERHAGRLTGGYAKNYLKRLRCEWR